MSDPSGDPWRIETKRGLGRLTFGMSPGEVAAHADAYGAPSPLIRHDNAAEEVEKVFAELGLSAELSPDSLAAIREATAGQSGLATQTLFSAGPTLVEYMQERLTCVMAEPACGPVTFHAERIFDLSARDALVLFETANGAPGRYRSTEAAFDNLAVSLASFCVTGADGSVRMLSEADEEFSERSIAIREAPYRPESEIGQFVARSIL